MLLDRAHNLMGSLSPETKKLIYSYLQKPTIEGWDRIHSIVIRWDRPPRTVWQALITLDPDWNNIANEFQVRRPKDPKSRWKKWPDAVTLARAIKQALGEK